MNRKNWYILTIKTGMAVEIATDVIGFDIPERVKEIMERAIESEFGIKDEIIERLNRPVKRTWLHNIIDTRGIIKHNEYSLKWGYIIEEFYDIYDEVDTDNPIIINEDKYGYYNWHSVKYGFGIQLFIELIYMRKGEPALLISKNAVSTIENMKEWIRDLPKFYRCYECNAIVSNHKNGLCKICYTYVKKMDDECAICITNDKLKRWVKLPCGHQFHYNCMSSVTRCFTEKIGVFKKCPLCREEIPDHIIKIF